MSYQQHIITSPDDPIYQAAISRNLDYAGLAWHQVGTPNNGITWDSENNRIKYSSALLPINTGGGTKMEEELERLIGAIDPPTGSTSKYTIIINEQGKPVLNSFGMTITTVSTISDKRVRFLPNPNK